MEKYRSPQQKHFSLERRAVFLSTPEKGQELAAPEIDTEKSDIGRRLTSLKSRVDTENLAKINTAVEKGLARLWPTIQKGADEALSTNQRLSHEVIQMTALRNNPELEKACYISDESGGRFLFNDVKQLFRSIVFGRIEDLAAPYLTSSEFAQNAAKMLLDIMEQEKSPEETASKSLYLSMVEMRSIGLPENLANIFGKTNKAEREKLAEEMNRQKGSVALGKTYTDEGTDYEWADVKVLLGGTMSTIKPEFLATGLFQVQNVVIKDGENEEKIMFARMKNGCECNMFVGKLKPKASEVAGEKKEEVEHTQQIEGLYQKIIEDSKEIESVAFDASKEQEYRENLLGQLDANGYDFDGISGDDAVSRKVFVDTVIKICGNAHIAPPVDIKKAWPSFSKSGANISFNGKAPTREESLVVLKEVRNWVKKQQEGMESLGQNIARLQEMVLGSPEYEKLAGMVAAIIVREDTNSSQKAETQSLIQTAREYINALPEAYQKVVARNRDLRLGRTIPEILSNIEQSLSIS